MRPDLEVVASLVEPGSRVLDLGCGDGQLLAHLFAARGCRGTGVDVDPPAVLAAIRRGVPVIELDVDRGLSEFADDTYDVVVVSQTLQAMRHPDAVLRDVSRIAGRGIVSVPNFGLWRHRAHLLVRGKMPMSAELPNPWWSTPNIHLSTLADLEALFASLDLTVRSRVMLDASGSASVGLRAKGPANLMASGAVYLVESR
ncbi:MAG: methionine biosynthesis protein MetW [Nocardioides sp.]|jgi:methionine biosynthesis protein MetW